MTTESYLYQRSPSEGYIVTIRKDNVKDANCFGELTSVNPKTASPTYHRLEAPLIAIRNALQDLMHKGYKRQESIPSELQYLVEGYESKF